MNNPIPKPKHFKKFQGQQHSQRREASFDRSLNYAKNNRSLSSITPSLPENKFKHSAKLTSKKKPSKKDTAIMEIKEILKKFMKEVQTLVQQICLDFQRLIEHSMKKVNQEVNEFIQRKLKEDSLRTKPSDESEIAKIQEFKSKEMKKQSKSFKSVREKIRKDVEVEELRREHIMKVSLPGNREHRLERSPASVEMKKINQNLSNLKKLLQS